MGADAGAPRAPQAAAVDVAAGGAAWPPGDSWLSAPSKVLVVPRPEALEAKLARFREAGAAELQAIMDFDHTLTAFRLPDGSKCPMCHDIVKRSACMPDGFSREYDALSSEMKEKLEAGQADFEVWWRRAHDLIRQHGLRREWIPSMLEGSGVRCRRGLQDLFRALEAHDVPALVVSAGITNFIEQVLSQEGVAASPSSSAERGRVRILANDFHFDAESGAMAAFTEPPMHQHAKASTGLREAEYFRSIQRRHVLILGDSPHDCDPLANIAGVDEAIRIGFFDKNRRETDRALYEEAYDVLFSNEHLEDLEDLDLLPVVELLEGLVGPRLTAACLGEQAAGADAQAARL